MAAVKGKNTSLERTVDAAFRARGWVYKRNVNDLPGKPDFVFEDEGVIVFVDGDFWHGWRFPQWKEKLTTYWQEKIERNRKRDQSNFQRLRRRGWKVLRFWSHQIERDLEAVVDTVASMVEKSERRKKGKARRKTGR